MNKCLLIILFLSQIAKGYSQIEISLFSLYEFPKGGLKDIYAAAQNYQLRISLTDTYKKDRSVGGFTLGYAKCVPKSDIFYYNVDDDFEAVTFSDYHRLQLLFNIRRDYILKNIEWFYGLDIGIFGIDYDNYSRHTENNYYVRGIVLGGNFGTSLILTKQISCFALINYQFSVNSSTDHMDFINHFFSPGAGINFRF